MNVTVYMAASMGTDPAFERAARELGAWIGQSGNTLVFGGSKTGLMGAVAQSALENGAYAIGIEAQEFYDRGLHYEGLSELIVLPDIFQRRRRMVELGDAFIALPGGTGTLEEIAEIMSSVSLKHMDEPCILLNINGYYEGLRTLLSTMVEKGLCTHERLKDIFFVESVDEAVKILKQAN